MTLHITINMDNDSFGETREEKFHEASEILYALIKHIDYLEPDNKVWLLDTNGNRVGIAEVTR